MQRIKFERRPDGLQPHQPGRPWLAMALLALLVACLALAMRFPVGQQPTHDQAVNAQPQHEHAADQWPVEFSYRD